MKVRLENQNFNSSVHLVWGPIVLLFLVGVGVFRDFLGLLPSCVFHRITGLPCLTCGATRSAVSLSRLDFSSAFFFNPLLPLIILAVMIFSAAIGAGHLFKINLVFELTSAEKKSLRIVVLLAIMGNWAYLIAAGI